MTGERGVVLQVKNRAKVSTVDSKEASWIKKKVAHAARQIHGTVRRLRAGPVEMTNGRGRRVQVDGSTISWIGVVIIDHPAPPAELQLADYGKAPTGVVTLLRRDWEFLFDQLRSTRQVVDYLHRVGEPHQILGEEPARYFELALADFEAEPSPPDTSLLGEQHSVPLLPMEPVDHATDPMHGIVRVICEDIANSNYTGDEHERLKILAAIDRLPVGYRTDLGQLLLEEIRPPGT